MPEVRPWSPGRGYRTAIPGRSWWRRADDGHAIIAVAIATPKTQPAYDGGAWTKPELWTVRIPLADDDTIEPAPGGAYGSWAVYMLNDKPHRITWWAEDAGRVVLERRPADTIDGALLTDRYGLVHYVTPRDRRALCLAGQRQLQRERRWRARRNWSDVRWYRHWGRQDARGR